VTADAFGRAREQFESVAGWLAGEQAGGLDHGELEERLAAAGREVTRQLLQDHLDLRAAAERRLARVTGADQITRRAAEPGHARALATVFGEVTVRRIAYRAPGQPNLHPADGQLNLPAEKHSHGLRRLAAAESARGSFGAAAQAISQATGQQLGKRQAEQLTARAAADFDDFYAARAPAPAGPAAGLLVLSCDGKGVIMRPGQLRPRTAAAVAKTAPKLAARLSQGEVRCHKRMAQVGAVYDAAPVPRAPADILPSGDHQRRPAPQAAAKWLTVSIADDSAPAATAAIFAEAHRRDPARQRTWIVLVDGDHHQIARIQAQAAARAAPITIICDFVHVIEYLWRAAWSFHPHGDPAAERWVRRQALAILSGNAATVAAAIHHRTETAKISNAKRKIARQTARYLTTKAPYLAYHTALARGWPIATGVIEGACRHLVKDRMDITGARWSQPGAQAILQLRALHANGDFTAYWHYHLTRERQRNHQARYATGHIPQAA
jgi:hypothetical protein